MEIFNNGQVTPHRLHTLVRLVPRMQQPKRADLLNMVQPDTLSNNQDASKSVFRAAEAHQLITVTDDDTVVLHERVGKAKRIESVDGFRMTMQDRLIGITDENADNFLLNLFAAWFAVQEERIIASNSGEIIANLFHDDMNTRSQSEIAREGRLFNYTKYNGWLTWATFLGWGWRMRLNTDVLIPDAHVRLNSILPLLLPSTDLVTFSEFMERIANHCPELDGGVLFEQCWRQSRPNVNRGNRASLMLSTTLRTLEKLEKIKLVDMGDALDSWQLYPANPPATVIVSHIQLGDN